ncbi:MAG: hypothetical protein MJA27_17560 [Pseudanabaenales cyanobacterium]|nr:hypothetical protein [Pseudanabaenales cyanobacterium]
MTDIVPGYDYGRERLYHTPAPKGKSSFEPYIGKAKPKKDEPTVRTPSLSYQAMSAPWADIDAVRGGTQAMRDAGELYWLKNPLKVERPMTVASTEQR